MRQATESGQPSASALDVTHSAEPSERREWVRIVPRNVNVSLSWQGEESRVSYFAELNDTLTFRGTIRTHSRRSDGSAE